MMNLSAQQEPRRQYAAGVLAGDGHAVSRLRLQIGRIAPHFRTALVTGECGVGKEAVVREMHRLSGKVTAAGPFQQMDISVFAKEGKPIECRGVLFLEGLAKIEPSLQEMAVKRLRSIQRDVRIIVASDRELRVLQATGRLLQSLAGRIGTLELRVAALRDRSADFEAILDSLFQSDSAARFCSEAFYQLQQHSWPGNFPELVKVIAAVADRGGVIGTEHLPVLVKETVVPTEAGPRLDKVMQRHVFDVLERSGGNKLRAAELLGISRSTLYRMLEAAAEQTERDDLLENRAATIQAPANGFGSYASAAVIRDTVPTVR